jgi:arsenate reductase
MSASSIIIYHNSRCGTSRTALELIRAAGREPEIVEYLQYPLTRSALARLAMLIPPSEMLRAKEPLAAELGIDRPGTPDKDILDAIADNPILLNRPIVESPKGARLCRPADLVKDLL